MGTVACLPGVGEAAAQAPTFPAHKPALGVRAAASLHTPAASCKGLGPRETLRGGWWCPAVVLEILKAGTRVQYKLTSAQQALATAGAPGGLGTCG